MMGARRDGSTKNGRLKRGGEVKVESMTGGSDLDLNLNRSRMARPF